MKKYLKFVLGLILIATILNPILVFVNQGEASITKTIEEYEKEVTKEESSLKTGIDFKDSSKKSFENNFNKSCDELLNKEFKGMKFESKVDCSIDANDINFKINSITVKINNNKIKKIQKVVIGQGQSSEKDDDLQINVKEYLSDILGIPKEDIEVKY